jgi:hypothetical protein
MASGPERKAGSPVQVAPDIPARLLLAAQCGLPFMADEVRAKLGPLLSYESMVIVAGSVLALAAANVAGYGAVVTVALGVATVAALGYETIEAFKRLSSFHELAMAAKYEQDFEAAGREFAAFVTIVGVNVLLVLLTRQRPLKTPKRPPLDPELLRAAWRSHIRHVRFKVPRDQGVLWSKVSAEQARTLARKRGFTTLEMQLEREGLLQLYNRQFGSFDEVKAARLESVTGEIWLSLSRRWAASLEGRVLAFVDEAVLGQHIQAGKPPLLTEELSTIANIMQGNPKISSVQMIDVKTGKTWLMLREQVLKATATSH